MRRLILKNLNRYLRQLGQGMTECILILAAVGIGGIFVYTQFGDVLRHQTAASALALAGRGDTGQTAAAREIAVTASAGASRNVGNFAGSGSYGGGGSTGSGSGSGDSGGSGAFGSGGGMPGGEGSGALGSGGGSSGIGGGMPGGVGENLGVWPPPAHAEIKTGNESLIAAHQAKYKEKTNLLLYKEVQDLIKLSPTLKADIAKLEAEGWKFRFTNGETSYVDFDDKDNDKTVFVSNRSNEIGVLQKLSHEVGHAINGNRYDYSSKEAHVQSRLEDEGVAVMKNIQVQREISANSNGKQDIGVGCGIPPCDGENGRYTAIYDQYVLDGDAAAARKAIAEKRAVEEAGFTVKGRRVTYREYYEYSWEDYARQRDMWLLQQQQRQRPQSQTPVTP